MSALKKDALSNIPCIVVTDEVFHPEMSPTKSTKANNSDMSVIRLVSAFENKSQASAGVLESPVGSKARHSSLMATSALLSATGAATVHANAMAAKVSKKLVPAGFMPANLNADMVERDRVRQCV